MKTQESVHQHHIFVQSGLLTKAGYGFVGLLKRIWSTEVCAYRVTAYEYRFIDFICYLENGYKHRAVCPVRSYAGSIGTLSSEVFPGK